MTNSTENAVLTDKDTLKEVLDCLSEHISIKTQGGFNQTDLFNILISCFTIWECDRQLPKSEIMIG